MKKLIAGNWKMNGSRTQARALIADIVNNLSQEEAIVEKADILVCPPALYISDVRHALRGYPKIKIGAQDCSSEENGAHTGDLSAQMLEDSECAYVILGHSERRQNHGETNVIVAQKVARALKADLIPIVCIGETQEERDAGRAQEIVLSQLQGSLPDLESFHEVVIAYEPVWAIGTGKTASPQDAQEMHTLIRENLKDLVPKPEKTRILYGGSMKPENAKEILACKNIDGGLIGGASLKADQFLSIARAA